jgi:hypothetical protein
MRSRLVSGFIGLLLATSIVRDAHAVCGSGFRVTVVQNSDIRLTPGAKVYLPIRLITTDLPIPVGAFPFDCGVFARSEVPGLSVVSAYGVLPPTVNPQGVWASIGIANDANPTSQPWFGTDGDRHILFTVLADGTTPARTQGRISLAVNEGGDIIPVLRTIGTINVIVGPSSASTWFSVNSTALNISANRVVLDHPLLNGNGGAKLFVSHVYNPPGLTPRFWNHPISAFYDGTLAKWTINNSDGVIMRAGLGFNVRIDPSATQYYTGDPTARPPVPFVTIKDPIAGGNPYATIIVGMTTGLAVNPHPVAVQYAAPDWRIVNSDGAFIPAGVRFNVRAIGFSAYHRYAAVTTDDRIDRFVSNGAGISVDGSSTESTNTRLLFFWWQLSRPSLPMIVTRNLSPMGQNALSEGKYAGLKYVAGIKPQWAVVYEDQSIIPDTASFNLVGVPQPVVQ